MGLEDMGKVLVPLNCWLSRNSIEADSITLWGCAMANFVNLLQELYGNDVKTLLAIQGKQILYFHPDFRLWLIITDAGVKS